jgi:hypothetical protein
MITTLTINYFKEPQWASTNGNVTILTLDEIQENLGTKFILVIIIEFVFVILSPNPIR